MAITYLQQPIRRFNEGLVLNALGHWFDYQRNQVFPNVMLLGWESDLLIVTKSGYLWEVEIKVTQADWRADAAKDKWGRPNWSKISRFFYAVPEGLLIDQSPPKPAKWWTNDDLPPRKVWGVPLFVPPWAGVFGVRVNGSRVSVEIVRQPKILGHHRISDGQLLSLYRSTYFRFWRGGGMGEIVDVVAGGAEFLQSEGA